MKVCGYCDTRKEVVRSDVVVLFDDDGLIWWSDFPNPMTLSHAENVP